jgi:MFS family permease
LNDSTQQVRAFTTREIIVAVLAAITSFAAYTSIFTFRKAFNVAPYGGHTLFGIDYKVALVITQVLGYMSSKFYGIRFISELKRIGRDKLIIALVGISWAAWLLFALLPPPYNFWCLFLNGFPLGMLWGVVFSYIEGRRTTDLISAALAVSFIFASGLAKSTAQWVMNAWQVSEYWMPFVVGCIFMPALLLFVYLLEKIPPPSEADIQQRMERLPMPKEQRRALLRNFLPGIIALVVIYVLVTILREVRDSFMADMWRESGEVFEAGVFAGTEAIITIVILMLIAAMILLRNNFRAFMLAQVIMLAGFVVALSITALYLRQGVSLYAWMLLVGLGLYMVYIPFNSILFDRFIAAFRFAGNVGFLIYLADSFGYLGSVGVLLVKTLFNVQADWLHFYTQLVLVTGAVGVVGTLISIIYFLKKHRSYIAKIV